jgi:predicted lysophospholipase L1 biosynthesis ABC-type transport system permease subunit
VEILVEILFALLQVLGEIVLQMIFELLAELGLRSVREPFRRPKPLHPALAAIGYAIFGAIAGAASLWLLPTLVITVEWLRVANLAITPVIAGSLMGAFGAWRRRRNEELIRLDRFAYGFLFAFAMALVRFWWGY